MSLEAVCADDLQYCVQKDMLLNCDDHRTFLLRHNKDPALHRPDICHQALLAILDSPLTKSGRLKVTTSAPRERC